jgi:6-phosphogluconate dehydrogenase
MSYGLIGLGTMGSNLAINISQKHKLHIYNRTYKKVKDTLNAGKTANLQGHMQIEEMTKSMKHPRTIITMLPHGEPSFSVLSNTMKLLEPGDTIIDCANEHYLQSMKNKELCDNYKVNYLGTGMSGGANGALNGPAIMSGGNLGTFSQQQVFLNSFCKNVVHVNTSADAGHFTKMVHNGIEYVMLQAIADIYAYYNFDYDFTTAILRRCLNQNSEMNGYLTKIAFTVLDNYDIDNISDVAKMNDTGLWCVEYAYKYGINVPLMHSAVQSRIASNLPKQKCAQRYNLNVDLNYGYDALRLVFAMGVMEGIKLIKHKEIQLSKAQEAWKTGTIIECPMVLLNEDSLQSIIHDSVMKARMMLVECVRNGISVPSVSTALQNYDFTHQQKTQMSLLMAQRNYFGQHEIKTN